METIEYRTIDKSSWRRGEWDDEPDKKQWRDPATGLPCLMVRNQFGNWCGYAGVLPGHPWHGLGYGDLIPGSSCGEDCTDEYHIGHRIESRIEAHGGLTFSGKCMDFSPESYANWRESVEKRRGEAAQHPRGDAARLMRETANVKTHEDWIAHYQARAICHIPAPGEPDGVWWFGFDCGHYMDLSPGMGEYSLRGEDIYRHQAYVEREVTKLAQQLAALK